MERWKKEKNGKKRERLRDKERKIEFVKRRKRMEKRESTREEKREKAKGR